MTDEETDRVYIRRQWNDYRSASTEFSFIHGLHWGWFSGGVGAPCPQPFIHGYVSCADVEGDIAHSCRHGHGPHSIKVCIVKKDNTKQMWDRLLEVAGPKPRK